MPKQYQPDALARNKSPDAIRRMFHEIAPSYDWLNRILSLGIDQSWRRLTARLVIEPGVSRILDVCCGTGDLAVEFQRRAARLGQAVRVIGCDFTPNMMVRGHRKLGRVCAPREGAAALVGDTIQLPFSDGTFDAVSVAFGIRNVVDPKAGLAEMARVVRPGGIVAVLEFSHPRIPFVSRTYNFYFHHVLPRIGAWTTGTPAYLYLPLSVAGFPDTEEFAAMMTEVIGGPVESRRLTLGIATLYIGRKPEVLPGASA